MIIHPKRASSIVLGTKVIIFKIPIIILKGKVKIKRITLKGVWIMLFGIFSSCPKILPGMDIINLAMLNGALIIGCTALDGKRIRFNIIAIQNRFPSSEIGRSIRPILFATSIVTLQKQLFDKSPLI